MLLNCGVGEDSESPLDCKEIQPVHPKALKEISPGCSLEGLMLKPKLQYFGHLIQTADSLEKTLMLGKIEVRRRRGWLRIRWLDGIINSMDMGLGRLWELVVDRETWRAAIHGITKSQAQLSDWTKLNSSSDTPVPKDQSFLASVQGQSSQFSFGVIYCGRQMAPMIPPWFPFPRVPAFVWSPPFESGSCF